MGELWEIVVLFSAGVWFDWLEPRAIDGWLSPRSVLLVTRWFGSMSLVPCCGWPVFRGGLSLSARIFPSGIFCCQFDAVFSQSHGGAFARMRPLSQPQIGPVGCYLFAAKFDASHQTAHLYFSVLA